ncbi:putative uncharacterized protein DDB_G0282133 isoform X2 [Microplitis demolitor]|uniref:putative uncharacterized protein DDB_G0282133 isoform X2 n=1 Tax=Microplitis demolitor TaxID=69319 RepID=UPI00235B5F00|nr:putative uncharacterized protein DDB_G0282133 isoform X2 [Microplitis demolitor]
MNNLSVKILFLFIFWNAVSVIISKPLEGEILAKEREEIFRKHGCKERTCDIIKIEWPQQRSKRSVDSTISLPVNVFGRQVNLNLRPSKGVLVGRKTPIYFVKSTYFGVKVDTSLNMFNSDVYSQLYEDEDKLASLALDTYPDETKKIRHLYIGSENLAIDQLSLNSYNGQSSDYGQYYLAEYSLCDLVHDILGTNTVFKSKPKPNIPIPDTIYPKILIIVDHKIYKKFNDDTIVSYLLSFWNGVELLYRKLKNPKYKLSIAGFVIAKDADALDFLPATGNINYEVTLNKISKWLKKNVNHIPFDSYDTHIVMTPSRDFKNEVQTSTIGLASMSSACHGINNNMPLGGIIYEPGNLASVLTAAHELGHIFGANHDGFFNCGSGHIMYPSAGSRPMTQFSECTISDFHKFLRDKDATCMFNKPDYGEFIVDDMNEVNNYKEPAYNDCEKTDLYKTPDNYQMLLNLTDFNLNKLVRVYYKNNLLYASQCNVPDDSNDVNNQVIGPDLQYVGSDKVTKYLYPSRINPDKEIVMKHVDSMIYIYQGVEPSIDVPDDNKNFPKPVAQKPDQVFMAPDHKAETDQDQNSSKSDIPDYISDEPDYKPNKPDYINIDNYKPQKPDKYIYGPNNKTKIPIYYATEPDQNSDIDNKNINKPDYQDKKPNNRPKKPDHSIDKPDDRIDHYAQEDIKPNLYDQSGRRRTKLNYNSDDPDKDPKNTDHILKKSDSKPRKPDIYKEPDLKPDYDDQSSDTNDQSTDHHKSGEELEETDYPEESSQRSRKGHYNSEELDQQTKRSRDGHKPDHRPINTNYNRSKPAKPDRRLRKPGNDQNNYSNEPDHRQDMPGDYYKPDRRSKTTNDNRNKLNRSSNSYKPNQIPDLSEDPEEPDHEPDMPDEYYEPDHRSKTTNDNRNKLNRSSNSYKPNQIPDLSEDSDELDHEPDMPDEYYEPDHKSKTTNDNRNKLNRSSNSYKPNQIPDLSEDSDELDHEPDMPDEYYEPDHKSKTTNDNRNKLNRSSNSYKPNQIPDLSKDSDEPDHEPDMPDEYYEPDHKSKTTNDNRNKLNRSSNSYKPNQIPDLSKDSDEPDHEPDMPDEYYEPDHRSKTTNDNLNKLNRSSNSYKPNQIPDLSKDSDEPDHEPDMPDEYYEPDHKSKTTNDNRNKLNRSSNSYKPNQIPDLSKDSNELDHEPDMPDEYYEPDHKSKTTNDNRSKPNKPKNDYRPDRRRKKLSNDQNNYSNEPDHKLDMPGDDHEPDRRSKTTNYNRNKLNRSSSSYKTDYRLNKPDDEKKNNSDEPDHKPDIFEDADELDHSPGMSEDYREPDHSVKTTNNNRSNLDSSSNNYKPDHRSDISKNNYEPDRKLNKPELNDHPSIDPPVKDLHQSVPDTSTLFLTPDMFNPAKLVVVTHKKKRLYVKQIDISLDDDYDISSEYIDIRESIPNGLSKIFHPRQINPNKLIIINYINKKTYINVVDQ